MRPTVCRQCGDMMEAGGDCAPSMGNPNVCVLCAAGYTKTPEEIIPPKPKQTIIGNPYPEGRWTSGSNRE